MVQRRTLGWANSVNCYFVSINIAILKTYRSVTKNVFKTRQILFTCIGEKMSVTKSHYFRLYNDPFYSSSSILGIFMTRGWCNYMSIFLFTDLLAHWNIIQLQQSSQKATVTATTKILDLIIFIANYAIRKSVAWLNLQIFISELYFLAKQVIYNYPVCLLRSRHLELQKNTHCYIPNRQAWWW